MTLLAPLALVGLITLPIIFILHLLHTRRKPLMISSMRLWHDLQQKRQAVMPRYIPFSLMLILQLCIAAALTLALARPALSFLLRQPQHAIFILDTTTSMMAEDAGPAANNRRFDIARQTIQSYLETMRNNDSVTVIGLNRQPKVLLSATGEEQILPALNTLAGLTPGATGINLPVALSLANGLLKPNHENTITLLTDGNYTINPDTLPSTQIPVTWQFVPAQTNTDNVALLNVSAQAWPNGQHRLFARVVNYGDAPASRTLRIFVNGQPVKESAVELAPQAETTRAWTLPDTAQTAAVEIAEPDALLLDNRAELILTGNNQHQVLLISDQPESENSALARALYAQPGLKVSISDSASLDRYDLSQYDLIALNGLPPNLTTWPEGNILVANPPLNHPLLPANTLGYELRPIEATTSTMLDGINWSGVYFDQAPLIKDENLPAWANTDLRAVPTQDNPNPQTVSPEDGYPLIFHGTTGNSRIAVWAFDLEKSNLSGRLALPLLTANSLGKLLLALDAAAVPLGEPVAIDSNLSVEPPGGPRLFLPAQPGSETGQLFEQTTQPGIYRLYSDNDNPAGGFAVHAGSALESNLKSRVNPESVAALQVPVTGSPQTDYNEFWPWLAGLVLVVVAVEGWLAWRR